MLCFPLRRKGRKEGLPKSRDCGIFRGLRSPKDSLGMFRWPTGSDRDPGRFSLFRRYRWPGKGWELSEAEPWSWDGVRNSRGTVEMPGGDPRCVQADGKEPQSCRNAEIQREKLQVENIPSRIQQLGKDVRDKPPVPCRARNGNVPRCAEVDGKAPQLLEKLGSCRNAEIQQEKLQVENIPSRIQQLGKDVLEKPPVPCRARNGNVLREGTDQPQPLLQAGSSEDQEGQSGGSSRSPECHGQGDMDTAAAPGGDRREMKPLSAAGMSGMSGTEQRRLVWERLCQLEQDMAGLEGESTAALAARLAQLILEKPTESYPAEPAILGVCPEQGSGASQDLEFSIPDFSIHGNDAGNDRIFIGMLRVCGNVESREDSEQDEDSDEEFVHPQIHQFQLSLALQQEFPGAWAHSALDCGRLAQEEWLDGDAVPFQKQWSKPRHVEEQMEKLLQEYLDKRIVEEGVSASNNPLILNQKRNGNGWRLTLNCTALNKATPVGPQVQLDRTAIMASISPRSRFFSVLDLCSACLAVPLARSCRPRFAFTFRGRQFLFARLPPTFHGAGSIVHRRVAAMLARLEPGAAPGVFHYSDDILITGKSQRQAEYRTRKVLELIQSTGFKVGRWKAQLVQPEVNYLGITIGAAGWRIPEEKVDEICEECDNPGSWNAYRLHSILGKFNSWRGFIPDYSELERPLRHLTRKWGRNWEWGRQQRQQLQQLQEALQKAPVLRFADKSRPFLIRISLHAETAGAALLQEQQGILLPVRFCSHGARGQPCAAHQSAAWRDLGCLEAVRAVQAFQVFTGPAPIVIQDPSRNYLVRGDPFGSNGFRLPEQWTLLLTTKRPKEYYFQNLMMMTILDAPRLRQLPPHVPKANVWFLAVEQGSSRGSSVGFAAVSMEERWLLGVSRGNSKEEAELEALQGLLEKHQSSSPLYLYPNRPHLAQRLARKEREQGRSGSSAWLSVRRWLHSYLGTLYIREVGMAGKKNRLEMDWDMKAIARAKAMAGQAGNSQKIWEPSKHERQEIIAQCHLQHEGVEETLARVRRVECWEGDRADVERWVRSCPRCREIGPCDPDDPDPTPQRAEGPWSCLRIRLSSTLPNTPEGFCALLVVQDALSGWLDAFPLRQLTEPEVTQTLFREVFGRFGKVRSVSLVPTPTWMWDSLLWAPLRDFWSHLQHAEPHEVEAAECLIRVARQAGKGWAGMLPLILAASRSLWIDRAELSPLLCIPNLPLELRWESDGEEHSRGNELSWLGRMEVMQPEYRDRLAAALQ